MSGPFTPAFPAGVDPAIVLDATYVAQGGFDTNDRRRIDAQILALETYLVGANSVSVSSLPYAMTAGQLSSQAVIFTGSPAPNGAVTIPTTLGAPLLRLFVNTTTQGLTFLASTGGGSSFVIPANGAALFFFDGISRLYVTASFLLNGAGTVLTSSAVIPLGNTSIFVNTAVNGPFPVYLPGLAASPPALITITDVGFALATKPLTINGSGLSIWNPSGPYQGQLTSTFVMNVPGSTYSFALVYGDPVHGMFWMPVGDLSNAVNLNIDPYIGPGPYTLQPISQWVPVNTAWAGGFTVKLPPLQVPFAMQAGITDVGFALATKPLTINGNGLKIWNPSGPYQGQLTSTFAMNVPGSTYCFSLVPNDPVNGTFWMPV